LGAVTFSRNFRAGQRVTHPMHDDKTYEAGRIPSLDREIIRVDFPIAHAGIAAALRRAFNAAAEEPSDRDFEALLRRLN